MNNASRIKNIKIKIKALVSNYFEFTEDAKMAGQLVHDIVTGVIDPSEKELVALEKALDEKAKKHLNNFYKAFPEYKELSELI